jgi:hypothetical protein
MMDILDGFQKLVLTDWEILILISIGLELTVETSRLTENTIIKLSI